MSSDGKEPGAVWQSPAKAQWQTPEQAQVQAVEQDEFSSRSEEEQALAFRLTPPTEEEGELPTTGKIQTLFSAPFEGFKQFRQYTTFILVPLLFFLVFSVIVLPILAVRGGAVLPFLFLFLFITVAQGASVYFLGSSNNLWLIPTVVGLSLFLLASCLALAGAIPTLILLAVLIGALILLARYCIHPVSEGIVDIVYAFGKYARTLYPGFNIVLPTEKVVQQLNVGETQWICPLQRVQLSRDEDVLLRASISYQVVPEDAYLAVTQVNQWEESLRDLFQTSLQTIATTFQPEDFIAWPQGRFAQTQGTVEGAHWESVNAHLLQHMRDRAAMWGVQVNWVRIRDVSLIPHATALMEPNPTAEPARERPQPRPAPAPVAAPVQPQPAAEPARRPAPAPSPVAQADAPTQADVPAPQAKAPAPKAPKEEVLIKAYKEVQQGNITDPETIRSIAQRFAQIANDPQLRDKVSFDAERAAANLFSQAKNYEEQYGPSPIYENNTKPDWAQRRAPEV